MKIGQKEHLGAILGDGYFIDRCPCGERIYLGEWEAREFLENSGLIKKQWLTRLLEKIKIPVFSLSWQPLRLSPEKKEISRLEKVRERAEIFNPEAVEKCDEKIKRFSRRNFERRYSEKGGLEKLEELLSVGESLRAIGEWFGFSGERARQIKMSFEFRKFRN